MPSAVFAATLNLLLLRGGPQDFPYDRRLSGVIVLGAVVAFALEAALLKPLWFALVASAISVLVLGGALYALLKVRHLEARFLQTWHSMLAALAVLYVLMLWPCMQIGPDLVTAMEQWQKTGVADFPDSMPRFPLFVQMIIEVWTLAVCGHILRHALNLSPLWGIVTALAMFMATSMIVNIVVQPLDLAT